MPWNCPVCTLINDNSATSCNACTTPKPSSGGGGGQWACQACTFLNKPSDVSCSVCATARPRPPKKKFERKQKKYTPLHLQKLADVLLEARLKGYDKMLAEKKVGTAELLANIKSTYDMEWRKGIVALGIKPGHAMRLMRVIGKSWVAKQKDMQHYEKLKIGRRVLVKTEGTKNQQCYLEGRLVDAERTTEGNWALDVMAPLDVPAPKKYVFLSDEEGVSFILPPDQSTLKMCTGAKTVSPFSDKQVSNGWAWYIGKVTAWDGKIATVSYKDGTVWGQQYPYYQELLDIDESEMLLDRKAVDKICNSQMANMPIIILEGTEVGTKGKGKEGERAKEDRGAAT